MAFHRSNLFSPVQDFPHRIILLLIALRDIDVRYVDFHERVQEEGRQYVH